MPESQNPTVPEWMRTEYVDGVIHLFQDKGGRLGKTVRSRSVTDAKELEFHLLGALGTQKLGPGDQLNPQNGDHSSVLLTPDTDFVAAVVYKADLARMSEDDRDQMKRSGAMALARRRDDLIIEAAAQTTTAALGGTGEFMSPDMSDQINEYYAENDIDEDEEIFNIISPRAWSQMKRFDEFTNADYTGPDIPWMKGTDGRRTWNGQHWIRFNRLPLSGTERTCFSWVKSAMAHGDLIENIFAHWSWQNEFNRWFLNMHIDEGAAILQEVGVLPIVIDEAVAPLSIDPDTYATS